MARWTWGSAVFVVSYPPPSANLCENLVFSENMARLLLLIFGSWVLSRFWLSRLVNRFILAFWSEVSWKRIDSSQFFYYITNHFISCISYTIHSIKDLLSTTSWLKSPLTLCGSVGDSNSGRFNFKLYILSWEDEVVRSKSWRPLAELIHAFCIIKPSKMPRFLSEIVRGYGDS